MKKTLFSGGSAFLFGKMRRLAAAILPAAALLSALFLTAPLDAAEPSLREPAAEKVDGQISVILEATIDGKDEFVFRDGKVILEHKSFTEPVDITVNGKPWDDLKEPFDLGFSPDPASANFVCEGRGESWLTRTDDRITVTVYDQQGAASRYRIILFQPSGVKAPLALPEAPIEIIEVEISSGSAVATVEKPASAQRRGPKYVTMDGTFAGKDIFTFRGDAVTFRHEDGDFPTGVQIGGKPWLDMSEPFKLGYEPVIDSKNAPRIMWDERVSAKAVPREDGGTDFVVDARRSTSGRRGTKLSIWIPAEKKPYTGEAKPATTAQTTDPATATQTAKSAKGVVIEGTFNGIGTFLFNGSRITYRHIAFQFPQDLTVNGFPWQLTSNGVYWMITNPDFELGFIPDYAGLNVAEQPGMENYTLTKTGDGMELYISDLKQTPRRTQIRLEAGSGNTPAPSGDCAELTIQASGGRGAFSFRKNMILFTPDDRNPRTWPKNVTVNGRYWSDLNLPLKLDYLPGFGTAEVLEAVGPAFVRAEKKPDNIEMVFDNSSVFNGSPTRFVLSVEKRPLSAPDTRFTAEIRAELDYDAAEFKFEGSRITYYPLGDRIAKNVTINGKPWTGLDKPFELGFEVDPLRAQLVGRDGGCTVEQMKYPDSYLLRMDNKSSGLCVVTAELNGEVPASVPTAASAGLETVTLGMEVWGAGRFTFRDNRIYFKLFSGGYPGAVTVNGTPWDDLDRPFELDFVPEFSTAKIAGMKTLGAAAELTANRDNAELYLNTNGSIRTYQIDLTMAKRKDAVPGSAPEGTEQETSSATVETGYMSFAGFGPYSPGAAANMADPDETVVFEVTTDKRCTFTFKDDTILCETPRRSGPNDDPPTVTLNGRLLNNLGTPIILNFIPDLAHADVTVSFGRYSRVTSKPESPVQIRRDNGKMVVTTLEMNSSTLERDSYSVRIVMKKLADSRRDPDSGARLTLDDPKRLTDAAQIRDWTAMMQGIFNAMNGVQLRSLDFDAEIAGTGVFEVFGDRITYRHESGAKPSGVTVGGKAWGSLDEPFELPFVADYNHDTLSYRFAADSPVADFPYKPVSLTSDRGRVYLAVRGIAEVDGGTPCRYHIHYLMSEMNLQKARQSRPAGSVTGPATVSGVRTPGRNAEAAPDMATVVLEGVLDGRGAFVVEGNTIRHDNETGREPIRVTVNGKSWKDLTKPFELDFTPDYAVKAKLIETRGRIIPMLDSLSSRVEVRYNDSGDFHDLYRVVFTIKKKTDGQ